MHQTEETGGVRSKYFETARRMDEALLALLEKKDFAYISIREICAQAGVNRSTFYLHYENTWDLLQESLEYMNGKFQAYFAAAGESFVQKLRDCPREEMVFITPEYLLPYLSFIKDHQRLYKATLERPDTFATGKVYKKMFRHIFAPILERFGVPEKERTYRMGFYVKGVMAIVEQWLEEDCRMPMDEVAAIIQTCVFPAQDPVSKGA